MNSESTRYMFKSWLQGCHNEQLKEVQTVSYISSYQTFFPFIPEKGTFILRVGVKSGRHSVFQTNLGYKVRLWKAFICFSLLWEHYYVCNECKTSFSSTQVLPVFRKPILTWWMQKWLLKLNISLYLGNRGMWCWIIPFIEHQSLYTISYSQIAYIS